ncbi:hypothetical protein BOS5A_180129 [Bosea sp. EC-HK365B]|nr:hypothetical protein BOSE21B_80032 [Bosea sp. 21B]CAD5300178.1 hypothetical protein BOSE7B_60774 [Bosea sp. 7B]VVT57251.1 hypothetical protein BOS5A_180129 [Bosea sp. EC-HK365B]VXC68192.1 hypothetical protein BOSE29B_70011 [Bosea sp. 29B]
MFGLFAMAIQEPVHWAGSAHLLETFPQRLPAAMQSNGHIVQRSPETCRQALTWLPEDIRTPDDIGVFRFQCRQYAIEAVADRRIELLIDGVVLDVRLIDYDFASTPSCRFSLIVGNCRRQDPA